MRLSEEERRVLAELMSGLKESQLERRLAEERVLRLQAELRLFQAQVARRLNLTGDWSVDAKTGEVQGLPTQSTTPAGA